MMLASDVVDDARGVIDDDARGGVMICDVM